MQRVNIPREFALDARLTAYRFGFAKFCDVKDSEMCIRGFHRLGYEVGFARVSGICLDLFWYVSNKSLQESFNSRLKAEGDEGSTNLYISNLPKTLTEVVSKMCPRCPSERSCEYRNSEPSLWDAPYCRARSSATAWEIVEELDSPGGYQTFILLNAVINRTLQI